MLRATADTNILISGLNFGNGKAFQFLSLSRDDKINLTVSEAIVDEMVAVLARKFDFTPDEVAVCLEMDHKHGPDNSILARPRSDYFHSSVTRLRRHFVSQAEAT